MTSTLYPISRLPIGACALILAIFGCEAHNANKVECVAKDCSAACEEQGFEEGRCNEDGKCECGPTGDRIQDWGTQAFETDTDEDTGTGGEVETEIPTETDQEPTDDTGTGPAVDTDSETDTSQGTDTGTADIETDTPGLEDAGSDGGPTDSETDSAFDGGMDSGVLS